MVNLFHAVRKFGKDSLRVRLEMKPALDAQPVLVNLFAFPFLSRSNHNHRKTKYNLLLDSIAESGGIFKIALSQDAMDTIHGFMEDFYKTKGKVPSFVKYQYRAKKSFASRIPPLDASYKDTPTKSSDAWSTWCGSNKQPNATGRIAVA